jgi:hypothetical protein
MAQELPIRDIGAINTYINPINAPDGNVIHCVNLDSNPLDGKQKRMGYTTYLGTPDNGTVNSLFNYRKNDGTTFFNYRASGSVLYYSTQGTGDWTACTNGTIVNGGHVDHATLDNNLFIADGAGSLRYTNNGTSFSYIAGAPMGASLVSDFQGRMYANGSVSQSSWFYSTSGTSAGTDWTTDSSSIFIPGGGKLLSVIKASDRQILTKNTGLMYRWDGASLVDMATELGPSSKESIGKIEDFQFWLNRLGIYISNAGKPQLISNAIQRQIYNDASTGITGANFDTAGGIAHRYDYFVSVDTLTDDLVGEEIPRAIIKYNYQKNEFVNYSFYNLPTAWCSYKDADGIQQLIFGDASGQCYTFGVGNSDNGHPIETSLQFVLHANNPFLNKEWAYLEVLTNPGCQAKVAIALEDTFTSGKKKWKEIGSLINGFNQFRFPSGSRGKFLFVRIYESSMDSQYNLYGINFTYTTISR